MCARVCVREREGKKKNKKERQIKRERDRQTEIVFVCVCVSVCKREAFKWNYRQEGFHEYWTIALYPPLGRQMQSKRSERKSSINISNLFKFLTKSFPFGLFRIIQI